MEVYQAKSIQILAGRSEKKNFNKKFTGAMDFIGPESGGKNN